MAPRTIHPARIQKLAGGDPRENAKYVLYWMQQSQRAECNHALEYAVGRANEGKLPLLVGFGLMDDYPEANLRHYRFLVEGLADAQQALEKRGIRMAVKHGHPAEVAVELSEHAAEVVCDRGYLRHQKDWRTKLADEAGVPVTQVESDVVVPVETASEKAEYAARTIRPKIHRNQDEFLEVLHGTPYRGERFSGQLAREIDLSDIDKALRRLKLDRTVGSVEDHFVGGTSVANKRLRRFLNHRFPGYDEHRSKPETDYVSNMGMYLHFGQISPVTVALRARAADAPQEDRESLLEELIVRRELAMNFVNYTPDYDSYDCLPDWARKTLTKHAEDQRDPVYTLDRFEAAETHDDYWNAAMTAMRQSGYLHNMMRMYWGKKILEWGESPRESYRIALALNNKYFLDGRDTNSFANVGWVFGLHDRPWKERDVYGTVRYLSAAGLERKCDIAAFVRRVRPRG